VPGEIFVWRQLNLFRNMIYFSTKFTLFMILPLRSSIKNYLILPVFCTFVMDSAHEHLHQW